MKIIPSEIIEPMLTKLTFTSSKYANLIIRYDVDDTWFKDKIYAVMVRLVADYYLEYNELPSFETVKLEVVKHFHKTDLISEVKVRLKTLAELKLNGYSEEYLQDEMVEYLKRNGLYMTLMESSEEIAQKHEVTCISKLEKINHMSLDDRMGLDYFENFTTHLEELNKDDLRTSFGWQTVDKVTNNGMQTDGRCMITFVAESGMGKSLMLSNIASNWCKMNKFAVIISLEMSETVYATRIDAHLSEMAIGSITENLDELEAKITSFKDKHLDAKLVIKEYPPESITSIDIRTFIDNLIAKEGRKPDILLVDYINLVLPTSGNKQDNSYAKIARVSRDLRALSYIYNCPVVSATQSNRDAYGTGDPSMDNISESMGIAHVSDFIGQLYQNDGDRDGGLLRMKITKNRFGGVIGKTIDFDIDYTNLIISDCYRESIQDELSECTEELLIEMDDVED